MPVHDQTIDHMLRHCPCGEELAAYRGATFICKCGRQYDKPSVNLDQLVSRVDSMEHRIKWLETELANVKATREST
jgi:hypothetical protein